MLITGSQTVKDQLREYSSRRRCQSIRPSLEKIRVYVRGWMNYYGIASMKTNAYQSVHVNC